MVAGPLSGLRGALPPSLVLLLRSARAYGSGRRRESLRDAIGVGQCGPVLVRPLRPEHASGWGHAMRTNYSRMAPWWGVGSDIDRATDAVAFHEHRLAWDRRLRTSTGVCLAFVGAHSFEGELQLWHLTPGGLTCEMGVWLVGEHPPTRDYAIGCVGYVFDRLIDGLGIQRIEAPVSVGNRMPRALAAATGFELEATIPAWRELHGRLVDYDLFALTPDRWRAARPSFRERFGEWTSAYIDPAGGPWSERS